jgi:DNA polymerase-1
MNWPVANRSTWFAQAAGEILYDKLQLPVMQERRPRRAALDRRGRAAGAGAEDYELPKVLLEYRSLSKLKSTYTDACRSMINPPPVGCTPPTTRR